MPDLTKQSDKVLAKFARRAATMKQVLVACGLDAAAIDAAVAAVVAELAKRNVQWNGSAE